MRCIRVRWRARRLSGVRCRANMAHERQSRPDPGLGLQVKMLSSLPSRFREIMAHVRHSRQEPALGFQGIQTPLSRSLSTGKRISHKVFKRSFCKSQLPHESVNLSFVSVMINDKLTDSWGIDFCKTTLSTLSARQKLRPGMATQ